MKHKNAEEKKERRNKEMIESGKGFALQCYGAHYK